MVEFNFKYLYCGLYPLGRFPRIFRNIKIMCLDFTGEEAYLSILSEPVIGGSVYTVALTVKLGVEKAEVTVETYRLQPELELEVRGLIEYYEKEYPVCVKTLRV